jgi:hypothetical protein
MIARVAANAAHAIAIRRVDVARKVLEGHALPGGQPPQFCCLLVEVQLVGIDVP